jgi:uncharacterized protein YcaQ
VDETVHILSPFDPLISQRKRLHLFFGYEHRFEAYVPKAKRRFGYFALPVLVGDDIVALVDLKTDREQQKLLLRQWTWLGKNSRRSHKKRIEEALHRFERVQLARCPRRHFRESPEISKKDSRPPPSLVFRLPLSVSAMVPASRRPL